MKRIDGCRTFALIAALLALGSSNPVAIKVAILSGWGPLTLGLCRMAVIGAFFVLFTSAVGEHPTGRGPGFRWALSAALCKGGAVLCFYTALYSIPVSRAVILSTLSPVVNLALVHLLLEQERVRRHHLLGIAVSLGGMLVVMTLRQGGEGPGAIQEGGSVLLGDLLMMASVVLHQAMIVFEKRALLEDVTPRQLIVSTSLVSVSVFAFFVITVGDPGRGIPATPGSTAAFLYLVTFAGVGLFFYRRWLVSVMEVTFLNSFSHAGRALSILLAVFLLGERVPPAAVTGFLLILWGTAVAAGFRPALPSPFSERRSRFHPP